MPSFAYSIARCWVIVSRPPLVIIGSAAVTPRIGLRARAAVIVTMLPAGLLRQHLLDRELGEVEESFEVGRDEGPESRRPYSR